MNPEHDDEEALDQFERTAKGELLVSPTGNEGGRRSLKLAFQLEAWDRRARLGVAFDSSTGFSLPDGSCLSPDACWLAKERWQALSSEQREGFAPLCPDAAFELRSKPNTLAELCERMRAYLATGTRLAVLIDAEERAVEVYRPGREPGRHEWPDHLPLGPELPGFIRDLGPIFGE